MENAVFELYLGELDPLTGEYIKSSIKYEESAIYTSDANGVILEKELPVGTYFLVETKAPDNYQGLESPLKITVSPDGVEIDPQDGSASVVGPSEEGKYVITVINTLIQYPLKLTKVDSLDNVTKLSGAKFTLYKDKACNETVKTETTSADGVLTFEALTPGTYYLKETEAPSGYTLLSETFAVTIDKDGKISIQEFNKDGNKVDVPVRISLADSTDTSSEKGIIVKNCKLYSLPSTGGRGIYWYLIIGMLLMMAASMIVYKNKCKEVLKS